MAKTEPQLVLFVGGPLHGQSKKLDSVGPEYVERGPNADVQHVYRWLTIDTGDGPVVVYRYDRKE